jgi:seryl-tRNA synthetase
MIDLALLRTQTKTIKKKVLTKDPSFDVDKLIELDKKVRKLKSSCEELQKEKNELAKKASSKVTDTIKKQSIEIGKTLKKNQSQLSELQTQLNDLWASCPNIPADGIPEGDKSRNKVTKIFGKKPFYDFELQNHVDLNTKNNWFDMQIAAEMSGSNFALYKNEGARVLYALTQFMIKHNQKHGFELIIPPSLVNKKALFNSSNLPKFKDEVYNLERDDLYLIPTAEVALTNMHANSIIKQEKLPIRYCAWTSCFRREAGGYGAQERGLIRVHQFEKVELYSLCTSSESEKEQKNMLLCAEELLQKLNLHYRVSLLSTQDTSFQSAKTYDIEVWLPGQNSYYEVSSISNCTDFQSRRASIRHRKDNDKPQLVHTLNGSSLALPRLMVAIMETYQDKDGIIVLPQVLQKYLEYWQ